MELPEVGIQTITLLQEGLSVGKVQEELKNHLSKEFDVKSFVAELVDIGFVKSIEGQRVDVKQEKKRVLFENVKEEHVKWLFSRLFLGGVIVPLIIMGIVILLATSTYWPKPGDLVFYYWLTLVLLGGFGMNLALIFFHELSHLFAARSLGVEGSVSVSNRLFYVVFQTDLTNLWTVPREKRALTYLAGIMFDLTVISSLTILLWLTDTFIPGGSVGVAYRVAKALIYLEVLRVVWQFMFYMRTDIYFVFANYFNCKNLYGDTINYLRNHLFRLLRKSDRQKDLGLIPESEMKVVRKYAIFFLVGTSISLFTFAILIAPTTMLILRLTFIPLSRGYVGNELAFIDSMTMIAVTAFDFILLGYSIWKKRRKQRTLRGKVTPPNLRER